MQTDPLFRGGKNVTVSMLVSSWAMKSHHCERHIAGHATSASLPAHSWGTIHTSPLNTSFFLLSWTPTLTGCASTLLCQRSPVLLYLCGWGGPEGFADAVTPLSWPFHDWAACIQTLNIVTSVLSPAMMKACKDRISYRPHISYDNVNQQQQQQPRCCGLLVLICVRKCSCHPPPPQLVGLHKVTMFLETPQQLVFYLRLAPAQEKHPHLTSAAIMSKQGSCGGGERSPFEKRESVLEQKHLEANEERLTDFLMKMMWISRSRGFKEFPILASTLAEWQLLLSPRRFAIFSSVKFLHLRRVKTIITILKTPRFGFMDPSPMMEIWLLWIWASSEGVTSRLGSLGMKDWRANSRQEVLISATCLAFTRGSKEKVTDRSCSVWRGGEGATPPVCLVRWNFTGVAIWPPRDAVQPPSSGPFRGFCIIQPSIGPLPPRQGQSCGVSTFPKTPACICSPSAVHSSFKNLHIVCMWREEHNQSHLNSDILHLNV